MLSLITHNKNKKKESIIVRLDDLSMLSLFQECKKHQNLGGDKYILYGETQIYNRIFLSKEMNHSLTKTTTFSEGY